MVSVVLPTRNRAARLSPALNSVLGQVGLGTSFDVEVIVVDDASLDSTQDVVRQYPLVRYVRLPHQQGASAARNVGIRESRGQYVTFQDDDDLWLPRKLSAQVAAIEKHPDVGAVYSQSVVKSRSGESLWPQGDSAPSGHVFRALLRSPFCGHPPCMLVRRDVFEKVGYFDQTLAAYEDYDLWLRIAFHYPLLYVPGAVAVYHLNAEGQWQTSLSRGPGADDLRRVVDKALALLSESPRRTRFGREIRLRNEWRIVQDLAWTSSREETWSRALTFLRSYPGVLRHRWARGAIAVCAQNLAIQEDSPLVATQALCRQLLDAAGNAEGRGLRRHVEMRLLRAAVWAVLADGLASISRRGAATAAARAVILDPSKLLRLRVLRALFRPFAIALHTGVSKRLRRGSARG